MVFNTVYHRGPATIQTDIYCGCPLKISLSLLVFLSLSVHLTSPSLSLWVIPLFCTNTEFLSSSLRDRGFSSNPFSRLLPSGGSCPLLLSPQACSGWFSYHQPQLHLTGTMQSENSNIFIFLFSSLCAYFNNLRGVSVALKLAQKRISWQPNLFQKQLKCMLSNNLICKNPLSCQDTPCTLVHLTAAELIDTPCRFTRVFYIVILILITSYCSNANALTILWSSCG